jgi:hypothetical protein
MKHMSQSAARRRRRRWRCRFQSSVPSQCLRKRVVVAFGNQTWLAGNHWKPPKIYLWLSMGIVIGKNIYKRGGPLFDYQKVPALESRRFEISISYRDVTGPCLPDFSWCFQPFLLYDLYVPTSEDEWLNHQPIWLSVVIRPYPMTFATFIDHILSLCCPLCVGWLQRE